jgi:hypothetical protein
MGSLIHVTAWERVSPWRRVLAAFVRVTLLLLIVIIPALFAYGRRYQLAAKIWHWRHGYSTTMGKYEVPVPEHWLPFIQDSAGFTLLNAVPTVARRDGKFHITAVVNLSLLRHSTNGVSQMESWLSIQRERLEREGVKASTEKRLNFEDEAVVCIGGSELTAIMRHEKAFPDTSVISLNCMSDHGLEIQFVGEPSDLQPFYTFVSQIRRHG